MSASFWILSMLHFLLAWFGFVHNNLASAHILAVHCRNHLIDVVVINFNKAEAPGTTIGRIGNDSTGFDLGVVGKECRQIFLRCRPGQISDI